MTSSEIALGTRRYTEAVRDLSDTRLTCRSMRHAWIRKQGTNMRVKLPVYRGDLPTLTTVYVCMRGCGVERHDRVTLKEIGNTGQYRVVDRSPATYVYPDTYQIPGIPRGVKPSIILSQEMVRRANEEIAHAIAGEREHADA